MNTEDVVAMIDAITDGREYEYINDEVSSVLLHPREGILFQSDIDHPFVVTDPRVAREIAGALVAWANRKESNDRPGEKGKASGIAMSHPDNTVWREDWYRRNISFMTQETKNRNLKDLREIWSNGTPETMTKEEATDIAAAIQILKDAGATDETSLRAYVDWPGNRTETVHLNRWPESVTDLPGSSIGYAQAERIEIVEVDRNEVTVRRFILKSRIGEADDV